MNLKDVAARGITGFHHALVRVSGGRVGGRLVGMPVVILETTGRKSGQVRRTMLTAPVVDGDTVVLVASYGGDDRHPQWYLNLVAQPDVAIELGGVRRAMRARVATAEEKAALWPRITKAYRGYAAYQKRTDRDIPVVLLTPRTA
ncbi:MAG TPA: nitroreductase family deazaflavin-dependent oxidoreductase [Mycobacteriales bacterium]